MTEATPEAIEDAREWLAKQIPKNPSNRELLHAHIIEAALRGELRVTGSGLTAAEVDHAVRLLAHRLRELGLDE